MNTQGPHEADLPEAHTLLTGAEVAALFRVHPKTVARWGDDGKIWFTRTPGGHRRYDPDEVHALAEAGRGEVPVDQDQAAADVGAA